MSTYSAKGSVASRFAAFTSLLGFPLMVLWLLAVTLAGQRCTAADTSGLCVGFAKFVRVGLPVVGWVLGALLMVVGQFVTAALGRRAGWVFALSCLVFPVCLAISVLVTVR
ncbi:hypothetical protein FPZ12_026515 [Amycolatopsis acidicola]|uniref:Uncharacterized protein n=1 Tax=Amycolatopsis acidicola TaxID=2596893 RepID=A0A5N0UZE6_9PSEU|nr:hypothetical protein [Amycolatopsis acidicola]KAA9156971.1 hypothetical protein FPZ12_026515 [Amycolatopsis acidicola]